jgi:hypothetical protein
VGDIHTDPDSRSNSNTVTDADNGVKDDGTDNFDRNVDACADCHVDHDPDDNQYAIVDRGTD